MAGHDCIITYSKLFNPHHSPVFQRRKLGHKTIDGCPERFCYIQKAFCALKDPTLSFFFFFSTKGHSTLPNYLCLFSI